MPRALARPSILRCTAFVGLRTCFLFARTIFFFAAGFFLRAFFFLAIEGEFYHPGISETTWLTVGDEDAPGYAPWQVVGSIRKHASFWLNRLLFRDGIVGETGLAESRPGENTTYESSRSYRESTFPRRRVWQGGRFPWGQPWSRLCGEVRC